MSEKRINYKVNRGKNFGFNFIDIVKCMLNLLLKYAFYIKIIIDKIGD